VASLKSPGMSVTVTVPVISATVTHPSMEASVATGLDETTN